MTNVKYWEFKNKSKDEADLYLYIEIASWGGGYAAHSAQSFKDELDSLGDINTLNVYINSPGGDVFEGTAITNMLKRHKAYVNVHVDGLAASIASVIAMSGDVIHMPKNAMMMIHNAWTYTWGNSNELRKIAEDLDKVNMSIKQTYLDKAGDKLSSDTITLLMDNETWLTAQECFDYGLCDVIEEEKQISANINNKFEDMYKKIPKNLVAKDTKEIQDLKNKEKIDVERELELLI